MADGAFLGIDIGGQSVKGIRLEPSGEVSCRASRQTPAASGAEAVMATVAYVVEELRRQGKAAAVGVGTPGAVDSEGRVAGEAVNIPGWKGTPLRAEVARVAAAPTLARNDGNLAAYAEWAVRGRASRAFLFIGLGTGIAGGFVEDGRILGGVDDKAVEIGHVIVTPGGRRCACGRDGCVEAYASGPSIARIASELASESDSALAAAIRAAGGVTTAREVYLAFAQGDELARRVHGIAADALARATASGLAFLAPDMVAFGGGVMAGALALVEDVAKLVPRYVYDSAWRDCRFERALLGPEAGLIGAALYGASCLLDRDALLDLAARALDDAQYRAATLERR